MLRKDKISGILWLSVITLLIFLFTFPEIAPDYGPGLDPSYVWGLNWLFVHDYDTLIRLIYPFGPLTFLKAPTCEGINLTLYLIFYSCIKISFIVLGMLVSGVTGKDKGRSSQCSRFSQWFIPSILLFLASYFANVDVLIIFDCLFLSLIYLQNQKWWAFVTATFLALLSFFIKISIGINSLSIIAIAIILYFYDYRNAKAMGIQFATVVGMLLLMSLLILHHPATILNWYAGAFHLVFGYGSLNLHYDNHKIWLILFILSFMLCPIVCKDKSTRYANFMMIIPLFAFWKHGIIREDCWHYFWMVYFIIVFWLTMAMLEVKRKPVVMLLGAVSILSIMLNAAEMEGLKTRTYKEFCSVSNINAPVFHHKQFVTETEAYSRWLLQEQQLPDTMLQIINGSSIDIYPFEFSYAAQNHLNWQPRAALGTALSPWLEQKSAQNFSENEESVHFVLWHFQKDHYGKRSASMDQRYFLNDEPEVVKNIINHYEPVATSDQLMLLAHSDLPAMENAQYGEVFNSQWDEWIEIPQMENTIVRVKVSSHKNIIGKIRTMIYKDISYMIEYQTTEGECYTYHYDPALATEGLWCAPFIQWPCDSVSEAPAVKFRLSTNNQKYVKPGISLQFEYLKLTGRSHLFSDKK